MAITDQILNFIKANPGCKGGKICSHVGMGPCARDVDKVLQSLRRAGVIEFRKGWFAKGATK